jgi:excisionase family DNA binding protein
MESMMTARQVAELLGVHENWVYDQAAGGTLPSYKIGGTRRFDPDELRGWIAQHREPDTAKPAKRRMPKAVADVAGRLKADHGDGTSESDRLARATSRRRGSAARDPQPRLFDA